jgi:hypothetical protein
MMKVLRSFVFALAIGVASVSAAQARDSFSIGINVGGHSHHRYPVVSHHVMSQPVYYYEPVAYHRPAPRAYYYAPVRSHSYYEMPRNYSRGHEYYRDNGHGRHDRHH